VGVGDSQLEAAFALRGPIPAGTWHLVADGLVGAPVDVQFDLIWRSGGGDVVVASFAHHFDPQPSGFDAVAFEGSAPGPAAAARDGDQLVLRFTATGTGEASAYIPNGDGDRAHGRIPFVDVPQ